MLLGNIEISNLKETVNSCKATKYNFLIPYLCNMFVKKNSQFIIFLDLQKTRNLNYKLIKKFNNEEKLIRYLIAFIKNKEPGIRMFNMYFETYPICNN